MPNTARRLAATPDLRLHRPPDEPPSHAIDLEFPGYGRFRLTAWTRENFLALPPERRPLDAIYDDASGYYARYTRLDAGTV
jgi:hypothetical protein